MYVCVLHRAQGVGGGFKTSLGKHKLQTVEITGVQTGRDPKQDPTFLCNPLPQACCLCSSFNGRKRQWGKTAKEGETKEMAGMFLMWLTRFLKCFSVSVLSTYTARSDRKKLAVQNVRNVAASQKRSPTVRGFCVRAKDRLGVNWH